MCAPKSHTLLLLFLLAFTTHVACAYACFHPQHQAAVLLVAINRCRSAKSRYSGVFSYLSQTGPNIGLWLKCTTTGRAGAAHTRTRPAPAARKLHWFMNYRAPASRFIRAFAKVLLI